MLMQVAVVVMYPEVLLIIGADTLLITSSVVVDKLVAEVVGLAVPHSGSVGDMTTRGQVESNAMFVIPERMDGPVPSH